ncbi:short chain dehydrogenase [Lichenihabitans sp. Uapishka_5]|uniref:short chain dehydrogenase n=1 Tax=Lichenihabitans sp. Uapishka_5 TaxID=3037302 RepID=UPI0029E81935|nr:short chain dehydrogenase [Lichenihabitans sp. Uapishka_5]MDX7953011.1 short chain dehydrogenase [Lichenihabitans sp. Uapishka_5]
MSDQPRLRILLVGASGVLGQAVDAALSPRHEVIRAGSKTGALQIDIADPASILRGFEAAGPLDAVCCTAGTTNFPALAKVMPRPLADSAYGLGLTNKLMGQVNLALAARATLRDGGSITLISGILADHPIPGGSGAAMVNGALESFVRAAACELPRGLRLNLVSPTVFAESMDSYGAFFRGYPPVPVAAAALAYCRSVEGIGTGQVFKVGY